ncbi:aminoacyl-tRNA hydrolase [Marivibrio halodurans]|uniref:Peptidyl-tRNA hydrolase n=1 Tax=Marivibrio halodurans TaxID=2039722 RepID=A0A8J7V427_9PROT|nr:aminoacyl-tRNA hydrolase [Marivibrio halodurans]MBP5858911.1 aminoacyl-tRNA hydrolase [Marivibrio halodurans]
MRLLVGLGNPGPKYEGNRHNIGFMAADRLVRRHDFGPWRARFQGQAAEGAIGGEKVLLLKPTTFMNESGRAVGEALRFFKLDPSEVLVIYDELDLALGKVRVKQDGGHGGHNGLKSIDAHIGKAYWRLRLGIDHPGAKEKVISHVLGDFAKAEAEMVERVLEATSHHMGVLVGGNASDFMSKAAQDIGARPPKPYKKQTTAEAGGDAAGPSSGRKGMTAAERLLADRAEDGGGQDKGALGGALKKLFGKD